MSEPGSYIESMPRSRIKRAQKIRNGHCRSQDYIEEAKAQEKNLQNCKKEHAVAKELHKEALPFHIS